MNKNSNVEEYIATFPNDIQQKLKEIRKILKSEIKGAEEGMAYGMPAYKIKGKAVAYFAGFKKHLGFYPFPSGIKEFKKLSKDYKTSTGTIQFPYDEKLPVGLIKKILKLRIKEVQDKLKAGKKSY